MPEAAAESRGARKRRDGGDADRGEGEPRGSGARGAHDELCRDRHGHRDDDADQPQPGRRGSRDECRGGRELTVTPAPARTVGRVRARSAMTAMTAAAPTSSAGMAKTATPVSTTTPATTSRALRSTGLPSVGARNSTPRSARPRSPRNRRPRPGPLVRRRHPSATSPSPTRCRTPAGGPTTRA